MAVVAVVAAFVFARYDLAHWTFVAAVRQLVGFAQNVAAPECYAENMTWHTRFYGWLVLFGTACVLLAVLAVAAGGARPRQAQAPPRSPLYGRLREHRDAVRTELPSDRGNPANVRLRHPHRVRLRGARRRDGRRGHVGFESVSLLRRGLAVVAVVQLRESPRRLRRRSASRSSPSRSSSRGSRSRRSRSRTARAEESKRRPRRQPSP